MVTNRLIRGFCFLVLASFIVILAGPFVLAQECTEDWICAPWSKCSEYSQTRGCHDANNCGTQDLMPSLQRDCALGGCVEDWHCGEWSECVVGVQSRTCVETNGCTTKNLIPVESRSCLVQQNVQLIPPKFTGHAVASAYGIPNPQLLVPTMLLMISLIALFVLGRHPTKGHGGYLVLALHITVALLVVFFLLSSFQSDALGLSYVMTKSQAIFMGSILTTAAIVVYIKTSK